jgi:hypothetical protein
MGNPIVLGGGAVAPWTAQGILDTIASKIGNVGFGWFHSQTHIVVLHPDCAVELANLGYSRSGVQEWLYEHSRVPFETLIPVTVGFSHEAVVEFTRQTIADGRIRPDRAEVFKESLKPGGMVPVVQSPEDFHFFVAGGSPGYDLLFSYPGPNHANQTKKITSGTLSKTGH